MNILGEGLKTISTNEIVFDEVGPKQIIISRFSKLPEYVFLGGTVNGSTWRDELIPLLEVGGIKYFNPEVDNWNEEAIKTEIIAKENSTYQLYVITSESVGQLSVAEAVHASHVIGDRCIFMVIEEGFNDHQIKSFKLTKDIISENGGTVVNNFGEIIRHING